VASPSSMHAALGCSLDKAGRSYILLQRIRIDSKGYGSV
jgi:hypothetical protein